MRRWTICAAIFLGFSLSTTGLHAASNGDEHSSDQGTACAGLIPEKLLCDLYNQAVATLRNHVEIDGSAAQRTGEFRLKFFPQGKSRSQDHLSAEGSFNLSPETEQHELTLRFKSSKPAQHTDSPLHQDSI